MENQVIVTSQWRHGDVIDGENNFFWLISKLYVDYFILGKVHRNSYIFKGVVEIGNFNALVQIGLKRC